MKIVIPFKTPTINHLYYHRGNIKILKTEARKMKEEIKKIVLACSNDLAITELKVSVEIYENWYCTDGVVKKKDIANREKFLIDSVFEALNIDDKYIFENTFKKINSNVERAVITIEPLC